MVCSLIATLMWMGAGPPTVLEPRALPERTDDSLPMVALALPSRVLRGVSFSPNPRVCIRLRPWWTRRGVVLRVSF